VKVPSEAKPPTFESLRPPLLLGKRDAVKYAIADTICVSLAACTSLFLAGLGNGLSMLVLAGGTALWSVLVFDALGLYRFSYGVFRHDEFYYSLVALAIAFAPMLVISTFAPHFRNFLPVAASGFCAGFVLMGGSRFLMFGRLTRKPTGPGRRMPAQHAAPQYLKRAIDVVLATIALIVFLPVMILTATAIYFKSGRPIFFLQERIGLGGRVFPIFKFRTMQTEAGNEWARPGDKRITRLGSALRRLSLDELPQILNVLRGDMSVVGPRPEMRSFAARFREYLPSYEDRHSVKPGLTGWAQVYMKRNLTPSDADAVLLHDLFYVQHRSIYLDLVLICKTAAEFLFHRAV